MPVNKRKNNEITNGSSSLYLFLDHSRSKKRRKTNSTFQEFQGQQEITSVSIPFRDDNRGGGAFFDHYTVQKATDRPSVMVADEEQKSNQVREHARQTTHRLPYGNEDETTIVPDIKLVKDAPIGLLFIPGKGRDSAKKGRLNEFEKRMALQKDAFKWALIKGQPVLAVCAGCWFVWSELGGKLVDVKGHANRFMPSIKLSGKIGRNTQVHRIKFSDSSQILASAMDIKNNEANTSPAVNSVHWKAPDPKFIPESLEVSAWSVADAEIQPKSIEYLDSDTIEAFESKHGAPILGIQWHPEAYDLPTDEKYYPLQHQGIIRYMAKAGDTYLSRCRVVQQIKSLVIDISKEKPPAFFNPSPLYINILKLIKILSGNRGDKRISVKYNREKTSCYIFHDEGRKPVLVPFPTQKDFSAVTKYSDISLQIRQLMALSIQIKDINRVKQLLNEYPNIVHTGLNNQADMVLHLAARIAHEGLYQLFESHGAIANRSNTKKERAIDILRNHQRDQEQRDPNLVTSSEGTEPKLLSK
jgi:gamma-glutamyl-gamma-aminobutyrate hydrolase PuuD